MKYPAKDLMHLDFCFHQCNDSRFYFPLPTKRTEQEGVVSCSSLQFSMLDRSVFLSVIFFWLTGAGEGDYSREQGKTYVIPLSMLGGTTN